MALIKFELCDDPSPGAGYVERFVDSLGDVMALKVVTILVDDYGTTEFSDLVRDGKVRSADKIDDLYYIKIDKKRLNVRFFGFLQADRMHIVHRVRKRPMKPVARSHFETARKRMMAHKLRT